MNCHYHSDREAVGACVSCGHLVCAECRVTLAGKVYCNPCTDQLVTRSATSKGSSWFHRHLNWTMLLGLVGAYAASFAAGLLIALSDPYVGQDTLYVVGLMVSLAVLIPVLGWALKRKDRSLWWLPLGILVPFGWVVLLCLENRSEPQKVVEP